MDKQIQDFFKFVHGIFEINDKKTVDGLMDKFEKAIAQKVMARFMAGLDQDGHKRCDEFNRDNPKISGAESARFLQSLRPDFDFAKVAQEETQSLTQEYFKKMLEAANDEQKQKIKEAAEKLVTQIITN